MTRVEPAARTAAPPSRVTPLSRIALWLVHVGVVASVSMQVVRGDYFPPQNSLSQYGVGPDGWVFTLAVTALGLAGLVMAVATARSAVKFRRTIAVLLTVWGLPLLLTGVVPADATASSPTAAGLTHMILSGLALIALPLAGAAAAWTGRPRSPAARAALLCLCALSEVSLVLLLLAANQVDLTGLGSRGAWALYQAISVVLDIAILYLVRAGLPREGGRTPLAGAAR